MSIQAMRGGRLARVSREITSVADAWLAARMFAWACVLPAMKRVVPVKSLAAVTHRTPRTDRRDPAREQRIVTLARWAARLIRWNSGGNCLERGLIAYRYLCAAGAQPILVVGMGRDEQGGVLGHAWVVVDDRPATDSVDALALYTPVFAFGPDGSLLDDVPRGGHA